ncbi:unnamed protein product (macronuclear) [Paramecium tetraurelia]|uniref:RRM domain-containing protein n=1 Tax=Paramecium tetraurelia TaxID=5888 RepID=A0DPR7_PARTE|nr:uncharacterized protein GSPATT00019216001 [Paramecium tetraurelia]CAK85034.1 unnamed protein product [Paramecium tetraurelia]|eukprot:XP_001452431.1 hypothetical protein (macronuclear) [Paramecium tetraurelia strain d4-2]
MSEIEEINLEQTTSKNRQQRQQPQQGKTRKPIRKFKRQNNSFQFKGRDRERDAPRQKEWKQQQQNSGNAPELYEIDIYNFLAKNQISDLISDIKTRCGELVKLHIVANNIQENEAETRVILKAFFKDKKSADECYFQYSDATLDKLLLRTERKY